MRHSMPLEATPAEASFCAMHEQPLPLAERGMIGNGQAGALVASDGAVDFLCWPRFDSPTVFGRVLDAERGGMWRLCPANAEHSAHHNYEHATNILHTVFETENGTLDITDLMPWPGDATAAPNEIYRKVTCTQGSMRLRMLMQPGFDYARARPTFKTTPNGLMIRGTDNSTMTLEVSRDELPWDISSDRAETVIELSQKNVVWFVLRWGEHQRPLAVRELEGALTQTREAWRAFSSRLTYRGKWYEEVLRSVLALKLLFYQPTGAPVAALTTSFPEWIGGVRNWDYRFTWTRDSALMAHALTRVGYPDILENYLSFVCDTLLADGKRLDIMNTVDGGPVPAEQLLDSLSGFQGSRPVRMGNGARNQKQQDCPGYILDAACELAESGRVLPDNIWNGLHKLVAQAIDEFPQKDQGIWEPRTEGEHHVHSKLMGWVTLDRAARIARCRGEKALAVSWQQHADHMREEIFSRGLDPKGGHFVRVYGGDRAEAGLLQIGALGLVRANDPQFAATVEFVVNRLMSHGYIYRYHVEDGLKGDEGAWLMTTFWWVDALVGLNRLDEAQDLMNKLVATCNHVGLMTEEVDPNTGYLLGNLPQAYSHLGLINSALRLERASAP